MPATFSRRCLAVLLLASTSLFACGDDDENTTSDTDGGVSDTGDQADTDPDGLDGEDVNPTYACGNGYVDLGEACDDGEANSDDEPNACRTDCSLPKCGDGVLDHTEDCDDGETMNGDGCSALCQTEQGTAEVEPNDTPLTANVLPDGENYMFGEITPGDTDCVTYFAPLSSNIRVELIGKEDVVSCEEVTTTDDDGNETTEEVCEVVTAAPSCEGNPVIVTYDSLDEVLVSDSVQDDGTCPRHNDSTDNALQNVEEGLYTTCVSGFSSGPIHAWQLKIEVESACINGELYGLYDLDRDGWITSCDDDDDGDGVPDDEDACPNHPDNGLNQTIPLTQANNFAYAVGFNTNVGGYESNCVVTDDETSGFDPATISAGVGEIDDTTGFLGLALRTNGQGTLNLEEFLPYSETGSRYIVHYLESDVSGPATLRFASDQHHQVWFNGERVAEEEGCGGITGNWNNDARAEVNLQAGLNRVVTRLTQTSNRRTGALRMRIESSEESTWEHSDLRLLLRPDGSTPESTVQGIEGFSCNADRTILQ